MFSSEKPKRKASSIAKNKPKEDMETSVVIPKKEPAKVEMSPSPFPEGCVKMFVKFPQSTYRHSSSKSTIFK